ncbi:MAG: hypothetical protein O8C61_07445 [Candidatus Methanoperedens sp.]|nr:hypothetical protein [Candidatus Methanoperedens sp.]
MIKTVRTLYEQIDDVRKDIRKESDIEKRLDKLKKVCSDKDILNDAIEITKHESSILFPGAILITALTALMLNLLDAPQKMILLILYIVVLLILTHREFPSWTKLYYDLIELRKKIREEPGYMSKEAEKVMDFGSLRNIVEEAIRIEDTDTSAIKEITKGNQFRYMQKYTESLISKNESKKSSKSYFISIFSIATTLFIIGISVFLAGDLSSVPKIAFTVFGFILMGLGICSMFETLNFRKEIKKSEKDAEFMHELILKIQEKLPDGN